MNTLDGNIILAPLFYAGLFLLFTFIAGKIAGYFNAPRITGYLIVGLVMGPSALGVFPKEMVEDKFSFILDMALGLIAFSIGGSMSWKALKKLGKTILTITIFEALGAFLFVMTLIYFIYPAIMGSPLFGGSPAEGAASTHSQGLAIGIVLGAMSAATAPAAALALIHQYRARGKITNTILGIVALDDALAILLFAFALPIAMLQLQNINLNLAHVGIDVYLEISLSLFLGAAMGFIYKFLSRFTMSQQEILGTVAGAIFVLYGVTSYFDASPLLSNMTFGFVVTNTTGRTSSIFEAVESIEEPIFGMFFALAGTHMDLSIILSAGLFGLILATTRIAGKYCGTWIGGITTGLDHNTAKYIGFGLFPQAGVTIGLLMEAANTMGKSHAISLMINAVLASVIINEIIAPFFVKYALFKSGEAGKR